MTTTEQEAAPAVEDAASAPKVALGGALAAWAARLMAECPPASREAAVRLGPLTVEERRGDVEAERRAALQRARQRLWADTLRDWPDDDFTGVRAASLDRPLAARLRQWWAKPDSGILILSGPAGRGKTYSAFAVANERALRGEYVAAISHKRYLDSLEPGGSDVPDYVTRRRAYNAQVLILDDLGAEMDPTQPASEFRTRETCDLLSARMRPGKRTIITTNLAPAEIATMFGDRIVSRLRKGADRIVVEGPDRRANGADW